MAAVFQAFLTIYAARVEDLLRIATNGRGVPEPGALHPDLVNRMAHEAAKSAGHVMTMCIRSLDYLPPVEPNFGDFLRALITADTVLVPDDTRHYRLAIIDAFRQWGLYPRDVSTLSEASLQWRGPSAEERDLIGRLPDAWWAIIDPAEALTWQAGPGVDRGRGWSGRRRAGAADQYALGDDRNEGLSSDRQPEHPGCRADRPDPRGRADRARRTRRRGGIIHRGTGRGHGRGRRRTADGRDHSPHCYFAKCHGGTLPGSAGVPQE